MGEAYDCMEEGIIPGGTGSLLYNLIFPNHAFAGSAKVNKPLNMSKSGEPIRELDEDKSSTASSAMTVAQIKNESKAKQLVRLEAANLCPKKRKLGDPEEPSSGGVGGAGGDTKRPVPFAKYRACTETTRKELKLKKHASQCHLEADAIRGKWEAPSPQLEWGKIQQGPPESLVASRKTPHHEGTSRMGVESTGQVWGYRQKAETPQVSKTKTSVPHELPRSIWPLSKTEEEFVYRLNVDSPKGARYVLLV